MTNTLKVLAELSEKEIEKAMKEVKGSDEAKKRAIKEINDYKYAREEIAKWFK